MYSNISHNGPPFQIHAFTLSWFTPKRFVPNKIVYYLNVKYVLISSYCGSIYSIVLNVNIDEW